MRKTETVLNVIQQRGAEKKPIERLYKQLFNTGMYRKAYSEIYANQGATTPGTGKETLDGMSEERIDNIIQQIRTETYRWRPARRTCIPKENGKSRPLGIPSGDDKILQTAMKILLEAYYEPTFSDRSHGFRPERGCHTALRQISQKHRDVSWFIEGDIRGCFDNIDHEILLEIMGEKIKDQRFLRLVKHLLKAGYVEDWKWNKTYSGTPQGGIISPLLANIYLDRLDKWVERVLLPMYNKRPDGAVGRRKNREYGRLVYHKKEARKRRDLEAYKQIDRRMKAIPTVDVNDENFRKLEYIRYADDFLLSFNGTKEEAKEIREHVKKFLREKMKLELSMEKTLITHAKTEKARFLGYDLVVMQGNERRRANGTIWLGVPVEAKKRVERKYKRDGKPMHKGSYIDNSDYDIISMFQSEYRGFVQYYTMAHNLHTLDKLNWVIKTSLLKTLAAKHKSTVTKTAKKYSGTKKVGGRVYKVFKVEVEREEKKPLIAHFGAVPHKRNPKPTKITDTILKETTIRSEIIDRLLAEQCEMCGTTDKIQVHHVRKLKDVNKPGKKNKPAWVHRMAAIRRKTLMTCETCHIAIHKGEHRKEWDSWKHTLESRVR